MHKLKSSFDMDYLKRIADEELSLRLEAFGAVQINGPKWWKDYNSRKTSKECS